MSETDAAKELFLKGLDCIDEGDFAGAEKFLLETIKLAPRHVASLNNLAIAQYRQDKITDAIETAKKAIEIEPGNVDARFTLLTCYSDRKNYADALPVAEKIIAIDPQSANAHCNRGQILNGLERVEEAIESLNRAIKLDPAFSEAHVQLGNSFTKLARFGDACRAYERALTIKPDEDASFALANILAQFGKQDKAAAVLDRAISQNPNSAKIWSGRGHIFTSLKRHDDAMRAYDKAFLLEPNLLGLEGVRLHARMNLCEWRDFDAERGHLVNSVRANQHNTDPFVFLGVSDAPADQFLCASNWVAKLYPPAATPPSKPARYGHDKIRVAYVSADFRDHPVAYLLAGVIAQHDKQRFETTAISFGPNDASVARTSFKNSFDTFLDVDQKTDVAVAQMMRDKEIDIAIDLMGFTQGSRMPIFAHRPAPVQINFLGYPGTSGAPYFDYIVADRTLISEASRAFYTEKVAALPLSYLPSNDALRSVPGRAFDRAQSGLPKDEFVFCCFNNPYKLTPSVFRIWMNILKSVDRSVLWLSEMNAAAASNLRGEATAQGVDPNRIIFAKRMPSISDHLARHRLADLFLDTLPYNAHTTASDALWAGLPVLTQIGEVFPGRVAAGLLNALEMPELITHSSAEYESKAIELASNPQKLQAIKEKLQRNRLATGVFNTKLFTRHLESAFQTMYDRCHKGLPPDHFSVPR